MIEIRRYVTESGRDVVGDWLREQKDVRTRAKIAARIARLSAGNFDDCKPLDGGVWELRIDWGPGYRILLCDAQAKVCVVAVWRGQAQAAIGHQASDWILG